MYTYKFVLAAISLVVMLLLGSCASKASSVQKEEGTSVERSYGELPSYFLNPNERYATATHLVAVGSGDGLEQAQQSALSGLAQQIEVQVNASFEASEQYRESSAAQAAISTQIFELSKSKSNEELVAVEYGETHQDTLGRIYAIAYINRLKAGNIYRERIEKNSKDVSDALERAESSVSLEKYAQYLRALEFAKENDRLIKQLEVLSPAMAAFRSADQEKQNPAQIQSLLREAAQTLRFIIDSTVESSKGTVNIQHLNTQIRLAVSQLLSDLQFQTVKLNGNYKSIATVTWDEDESSQYPTVFWNLNFQILELADSEEITILSKSEKGRSKGISIEAASRLAINDMSKKLTRAFAAHIKDQLTQ